MKTYAISQQKGGVGKTTNTINTAGALAHRGHDVLAIDADPQGYLTNTLGFRDAYQSNPPSLYNAIKSPHEHDVQDLVVEHAEFDLLPANIDMFQLEQDLIASGRRPRQRFDDVLDELTDYDYVLIDAPPSLGPINDNVLLAAEDIIIPVEADDSSVLAIEHLLNQIESLERGYDVTIQERAILISNVNYPLDNEQRDAIEWFEETFEGRAPVFEIRNRAAIKRSLSAGGSIFGEDAEETDMTSVYLDVAATLEEVSD